MIATAKLSAIILNRAKSKHWPVQRTTSLAASRPIMSKIFALSVRSADQKYLQSTSTFKTTIHFDRLLRSNRDCVWSGSFVSRIVDVARVPFIHSLDRSRHKSETDQKKNSQHSTQKTHHLLNTNLTDFLFVCLFFVFFSCFSCGRLTS